MLGSQDEHKFAEVYNIGTLIRIGEITGAYEVNGFLGKAKQAWRVSEDGAARDTYKNLTKVFDMPELEFFRHYAIEKNVPEGSDSYLKNV